MKNKRPFRIVCLKNQASGAMGSAREVEATPSPPTQQAHVVEVNLMPSLVHLSARIQGDGEEALPVTQPQKVSLLLNTPQPNPEDNSAEVHRKKRKLNLNIQKYMEDKRLGVEKEKDSVIAILGDVDFSFSPKREHKMDKMIRSVIKDEQRERVAYKKKVERNKMKQRSLSENKDFLQSCFRTFIVDKSEAIERKKLPMIDEDKDEKELKKLAVTNPEEKSVRLLSYGQRLDLFGFLKKKDHQAKRSKTRKELGRRTRFDELTALKSTLKTDHEQFKWSRATHAHAFNFSTIQV